MPTRTTCRRLLALATIAVCALAVGLAAALGDSGFAGDHDATSQTAAALPAIDDDTPVRVVDRPEVRRNPLPLVLVAVVGSVAAVVLHGRRHHDPDPPSRPVTGFGPVGRRAPPVVHSI